MLKIYEPMRFGNQITAFDLTESYVANVKFYSMHFSDI